jgi:hypothetical protein
MADLRKKVFLTDFFFVFCFCYFKFLNEQINVDNEKKMPIN